MGALVTYYDLKKQADQEAQNGMVQPQQPVQQPQIDTSDPINSLAGMLVTPAEREAQQQKMLRNKRRMIAWTGLFDGLRNLANLYTVSKGAAPMKFTDNPYQTIEQSFKEEQQRQDNLNNYQDRYAKQLYDLQRQGEQDQMRREAQQAQIDYSKSRIKMQEEESKRKDEYTKARNKYYEALANKNYEQAEYWRLKADGVPAESAAKIAKDRAQAQKALSGGSSSGGRGRSRSSSDGYETIVTEGYDENGNKVKRTVKQPRSQNNSKKPTETGKGRSGSGGSNKSGFFN